MSCTVCIIIKLGHLVHISHANSMDSNTKFSTARCHSLAKNLQNYDDLMNHVLMMKNMSDIKNNKTPHVFTPPRPVGSGGVKIWGVSLFLNIMKIRNNDFITIRGLKT